METGDKTLIGVRRGKVSLPAAINLMVWTHPPGEAPDKQKPTLNNYLSWNTMMSQDFTENKTMKFDSIRPAQAFHCQTWSAPQSHMH